MMVIRNAHCGHPLALGTDRDQLAALKAELERRGRHDFRVQTISSSDALADQAKQLAEDTKCGVCRLPEGFPRP
jgi:hypothetical protein